MIFTVSWPEDGWSPVVERFHNLVDALRFAKRLRSQDIPGVIVGAEHAD